MEINAAARLTAGNVPWDKTFKKILKRAEGSEGRSIKTHAAGILTVDQAAEEVVDKLSEKYKGGSLLDELPNIELHFGSKVVYLTWNEAYTLGQALIGIAEVSYYG